jgi:SAM-dependent methyltransferase
VAGSETGWLRIPAADYQRHMEAVGQTAALRSIFRQVYAAQRPRRVLVLGCTTGGDLALIEPATTTRAVGIDINATYIEEARRNLAGDGRGRGIDLVCADVFDADLGEVEFDLIHVALLFEYVEPAALFRRVRTWLAGGGVCSVVTQDPSAAAPLVSPSPYESLRLLEGHMSLLTSDALARLALDAGLERTAVWTVALPGAKTFSTSVFRRASP